LSKFTKVYTTDGNHGSPSVSTESAIIAIATLRGKSNFGDSSGQLFSIYFKAAGEEGNKFVEH